MGRNSIVSVQKIIDTSRDLFSQYGYSKTTIEDIASALHVGKSSLYYYFKDKEGILKAVLDPDIGKIRERVATALAAAQTPQEKLLAYWQLRKNSPPWNHETIKFKKNCLSTRFPLPRNRHFT
jgi:AcrR family transcriptional regulator